MRAIDADELRSKAKHVKDIFKYDEDLLVVGLGYILDAKTIETQQYIGKWIQVDEHKQKCSNCDTTFIIYAYPSSSNICCPNCGAKMK